MRIKHKLLCVRVMLCGCLALSLMGCKAEKIEKKEVVRPVKTIVISTAQKSDLVFPGKVRASQRVDLSFRISGPLIELPIKEGEEIKKGQKLAKIDPRDYKIALDKATAEFTKAKADFERSETLYKSNAVSKAEYENNLARYNVSKSNLENAEANLDDTELKSPFSGTVVKKHVDNFQDVSAKQNIVSIHDISSIEVIIDVPENIVVGAKKGMAERRFATFSALPGKEFDLDVKEFSTKADSSTQTYRATLIMPKPEDINILPGMSCEVHFHLKADEPGAGEKFLVPSVAVASDEAGNPYVWIIDKDLIVKKRSVTVGSVTGKDSIEILSGLQAGERIAIAGVSMLREGMKIKLIK